MATAPGVFVQLSAAAGPPQGFMGYQCFASEGMCRPVQAMSTYDQNFPLYNSRQECEQVCGGASYGSYTSWGGGDLDVDPGPKKAPK